MEIAFWVERFAILLLICIGLSETTEGLDLIVLLFLFSNTLYFALFLDEMNSKNNQKKTGENGNIISKESQVTSSSQGGGNCSCQEEENKGKEDKRRDLERTCSTVASDFNTKTREDDSDKKETRKLKARLEEDLQMKMSYDESGKKNALEASRNKYEEDNPKKLKEKKEKGAKELKQATEKYEEDCGKWEEERCNIAAKLYDATISTQVYQRLLQISEENGCKLEEEKNKLASQLSTATAQSELYRSILRDPCYTLVSP